MEENLRIPFILCPRLVVLGVCYKVLFRVWAHRGKKKQKAEAVITVGPRYAQALGGLFCDELKNYNQELEQTDF